MSRQSAPDRVALGQPGPGVVRRRAIASLLVVTPLGFLFKLYAGPGQRWFNNYGAGVLYVVFWCLVLFLVWPRWERATGIAAGVLAATCLLEVLQLWHPPLLEQVRATFLGRALLGTTFAWWDLPHYVLGAALAWWWMRRISLMPPPQSPLQAKRGGGDRGGATSSSA